MRPFFHVRRCPTVVWLTEPGEQVVQRVLITIVNSHYLVNFPTHHNLALPKIGLK